MGLMIRIVGSLAGLSLGKEKEEARLMCEFGVLTASGGIPPAGLIIRHPALLGREPPKSHVCVDALVVARFETVGVGSSPLLRGHDEVADVGRGEGAGAGVPGRAVVVCDESL